MTHAQSTNSPARKPPCTISIRLVWPFVELARHQGEPQELVAQLQVELGLTQAEYEDPDTRVPLQRVVDLLERTIARTGLRDIGLRAALHVTSEHIGVAEYLGRSKATLGAGLMASGQYLKLLGDAVHQSLESQNGLAYARLWFDSSLVMPDAMYEFAVATYVHCARRIATRPDLTPVEVHFVHPKPHDVSTHERTFNCTVHFNMPITQMVFDAEVLAIPLPNAEPALSSLLERHANAALKKLPSTDDFVTRVRDLLTAEVDLRKTNAPQIAQRLGVSVRTLARRLDDESVSYRALLDETRKHTALRDLAQTRRPLNDIARQLGFASSQSFHRAFRRWTGDTAASYRERSRRRQDIFS